MLLGSGVKGAGGALLGYRSSSGRGDSHGGSGGSDSEGSSLAGGWQYTGPVCSVADLEAAAQAAGSLAGATSARPAAALTPAAAAHELGEVWECPLLAQPPPAHSGSSGGWPGEAPWLLAVSPYPCKPPNVKTNPVLYWIGRMDAAATRKVLESMPQRLSWGRGLWNCSPAAACCVRHALEPSPPALRQLQDQGSARFASTSLSSAAGLTWPPPRAPSGWTWERCCMRPTCAAPRCTLRCAALHCALCRGPGRRLHAG